MALRLGPSIGRDPPGEGGNPSAFRFEKETCFDAAAAVSGPPILRAGHGCRVLVCGRVLPAGKDMLCSKHGCAAL